MEPAKMPVLSPSPNFGQDPFHDKKLNDFINTLEFNVSIKLAKTTNILTRINRKPIIINFINYPELYSAALTTDVYFALRDIILGEINRYIISKVKLSVADIEPLRLRLDMREFDDEIPQCWSLCNTFIMAKCSEIDVGALYYIVNETIAAQHKTTAARYHSVVGRDAKLHALFLSVLDDHARKGLHEYLVFDEVICGGGTYVFPKLLNMYATVEPGYTDLAESIKTALTNILAETVFEFYTEVLKAYGFSESVVNLMADKNDSVLSDITIYPNVDPDVPVVKLKWEKSFEGALYFDLYPSMFTLKGAYRESQKSVLAYYNKYHRENIDRLTVKTLDTCQL